MDMRPYIMGREHYGYDVVEWVNLDGVRIPANVRYAGSAEKATDLIATLPAKTQNRAKQWYAEARARVAEQAEETGYTRYQIAKLYCYGSIRSTWLRNVVFVERILEAWNKNMLDVQRVVHENDNIDSMYWQSFGIGMRRPVASAFRALADLPTPYGGYKVRDFTNAFAGLSNLPPIDRWMMRAYVYNWRLIKGDSPPPKVYIAIQRDYCRQFTKLGMDWLEGQACVWVAIKVRNGDARFGMFFDHTETL